MALGGLTRRTVASRVQASQQYVAPVRSVRSATVSSTHGRSNGFALSAPAPQVFGTVGLRRSLACAAAATDAPPKEETFQYQAEVDRLMDMIVNSLYSNREVFLRELISNASDALDKARFVSLTKGEILKGKEELEIRIKADKEKNIIIIEDSGIGMTREQLLSNLGTIARSGTRKFMEMMKENKASGDNSLIGQFGVGFYSAFLVADRVTVQSRSPDEDAQWVWEAAAGSHQYKIYKDPNASSDNLVRGTRVILHLKEDAVEMADPVFLARLIKQYSQFIAFPIKLYSMKKEPVKIVDEEATKRKQEAEVKKAAEKSEEVKTVEPVLKTDYKEVWDWRVENENKPLWTRPPKEVSNESYNDFFKATFSEFLEPLSHVHFNVEGTIEFVSILYIPGMAPFDQQSMQQRSRSIKLYVKRVFISDEFDEDLMPRWLSFIKGVVDSSDLPLNVSREILQQSRIVRVIRKQLVRRSIDMMEDLANKDGGEDYKTFWESFGRQVKIGVIEDTENRARLAKLLRFYSSKSEDALTGLEDYVSRMKEGQKSIYYMAGDNVQVASAAPFVEKLVAKGFEVLYLTDAIDEATVTNLQKYSDKELVDVSKEGVELTSDPEDKAKEDALAKDFAGVADFLKKTLADRVEKVNISNRLTDSPCALVTSKFGWSANMERIMRTQALGDPRSLEYMKGKKILEINPEHPIVRGLKNLLAIKDEERARDLSELLFETSLITSGFQVEQPKLYADKVFMLMGMVMGDAEEEGHSSGPEAQSEKNESGSSTSQATAVEAEIMSEGNDPWKK